MIQQSAISLLMHGHWDHYEGADGLKIVSCTRRMTEPDWQMH
jgi:hypothetical protein